LELTLSIDIPPLPQPIKRSDSLLLLGSCFTENMADRLQQHKFKVVSNPHGILFNPLSVANSLNSYLEEKLYTTADLFFLNELWNSWAHHTRFSHTEPETALAQMNAAQKEAIGFVRQANWVVITLGSAFQYYLKKEAIPVANNHRAPGQWFEKKLLEIDDIVAALGAVLQQLFSLNPQVQVLFTISPVRHIRDGVVANNRSKARLLEAVHTLCSAHKQAHYFPAYELVLDILRDYRFFDVDFVHPNYLATSYVWERFVQACMDTETQASLPAIKDIATAYAHRPRFPQTQAHRQFIESYCAKTKALQEKFPYLDWSRELKYFTNGAS
jgi:hypothetical protein